MSRYIGIPSCKECPHRHYYSAGLFECLKYGTTLPWQHDGSIPEWCPLPKLPKPASTQETAVEYGDCPQCRAGTGHGGKRIHLAGCPALNRGQAL